MTRILVAYASLAGSTADVAEVVGDEIAKSGAWVDVLPLDQVRSIDRYDAVVVGAPMIMGWHRGAAGFLQRHRAALRRVPLAVFVTAMRLTRTDETSVSVDGVVVFVDEKLPRPPARAGQLNFRERYARLGNYIRPILAASRPAKLVAIGIFGGQLEYGRLPWWAVLFVKVIIQAPAGDRRNWPAIHRWAAGLSQAFHLETAQSAEPQPVA